MSKETSTWLHGNILVGFASKRGKAWWFDAERDAQLDESSHYDGEIPVEDIKRRLFGWKAVSQPVLLGGQGLDGTGTKAIAGRQAIVREDTGHVFNIFKAGYTIHQYEEWLLGNVANLLDDGLSVGSAGLLRAGGVAWVSVEVPDNIVTPEGVEFRPNLLACTSHDGSLSTTYKRVVTNVVCDNTMAAGLAEQGQQVKIRHSAYSAMRLQEARDALAIVHSIEEDFAAEVAKLTAEKVGGLQFKKFIEQLVPLPSADGLTKTRAEEKRGLLQTMWTEDPRVAPWTGTAWGAVQLVNTYTQHTKAVRGMHRAERNALDAVTGEFDELDAGTLRLLRAVA